MRKLVTMIAVAAVLGASPAVGASLSLKPKPAAGQMLRDHGGHPAMQSALSGSTVALVVQSVTLDETGSASFLLALQNSSPAPLSVGAADLVVRAGERKVRIYSAEDLRAAARDLKLLAQSHVHAMDRPGALGAQHSRAGYVALPGGGYLQDPNPPQGSKKQVLAEANRRIAAADEALAQADTLGFRPVALAPGASGWTGLTLAALPKAADTLTISVTLGADTHRFELTIDR